MAFKLKASSPLRIETDPKLRYNKYKEYSLEKDMDYLNKNKKAVASNKSTKQGFLASFSPTNRAQARVDSYKKRGGKTTSAKPDKLKAGEGVLKTPKIKPTPKIKKTKTPTNPPNRIKDGLSDAKKTIKKEGDLKNNKRSFKSAYAKRDMKTYGNLSQSQFTAESKRQIASKKAGKGYDAPKKSMAGSKARKKVESIKVKATGVKAVKQYTKAQKLRVKGVEILANKKLSTPQKQKQARSVRKQYDAEMAKNKKKKPVVKAKKKVVEVVAK